VRAVELFSKDRFSGYVYRAMQEIRARGRVAAGMPAGMERIIGKTGALSPQRLSSPHIRRNDPCPCGSGQRFKHCHGGRANQDHP
jgi:uncharacterized protein YecA (UPF0149 family)